MPRIEKTIFISYRRKDISWALAVYQYLTSQKYDVFFDYTSLSGGDFEQVIVSNIKARAHFLLILTPTALDRCHEPGDWLRREIEMAVDEKRNIIPLFFDGFNFSSPSVAQKLTGKLSSINRYNGLDVPAGYFLEAMGRLSSRYLNVPLNAVIHPVSTEVRKVVKEEQIAADIALIQKSEDIKELITSAKEKLAGSRQTETKAADSAPVPRIVRQDSQRANWFVYGIGSAIVVLVILGLTVNALMQKNAPKIEPSLVIPISGDISLTPPTETAIVQLTPIQAEATLVDKPPLTVTSLPTAGADGIRISPTDGATLLFIPPGTFTMGLTNEQVNLLRTSCNSGGCEELFQASWPDHTVRLTKGFWIYQMEVSNAEYAKCVGAGNCSPPRSYSSAGQPSYYDDPAFANYPVVWVDWYRADAYCSWAGGHLPSSAEWEYAARGSDGRLFPWGNDLPDGRQANVNSAFGVATSIDRFAEYPSPFGLLNVTGNVWEWVSDWYSATYYRENTDWTDPKGPADGIYKVGRGGNWWAPSALSNIAIQDWEFPDNADGSYSYDSVGFRCAVSD
jgi:formylglycine-generating enzyme required for sulfatase activity